MKKIILVTGARPNFMKIAPLFFELLKHPSEFSPMIVLTGQHYDRSMSGVFLDDLKLPSPDVNLKVGSGSHAAQTGRILMSFERVLLQHRPDLVVVVGDVNSTLACALAAVKLKVRVAHVEAGLRSFDRDMPEEINRVVTDSVSDLLFTTCEGGGQNLRREGHSEEKIYFVGNPMIDSLLRYREMFLRSRVLEEHGLSEKEYCVLTLHRASNVDRRETFQNIMSAVKCIGKQIPVIFPVHPRSRRMLAGIGLEKSEIILTEPMGYLDFLKLEESSKLVLTDSGGIQEETTFFKVPCLTLRENTERPVTITQGTNRLVGLNPQVIVREVEAVLQNGNRDIPPPALWDGKASRRIVEVLANHRGLLSAGNGSGAVDELHLSQREEVPSP
ncbi:MAG: UDP-N-acetylglucosamine 2-epimerase (non-hydrolyzing) [Candidatus Zixiibacteriota bacterium]|nr:MAG: UDP-N-acetylglucosamine 2-epimerase (non-hydrolyzing) [candidate division Zixibacteria bacterium]